MSKASATYTQISPALTVAAAITRNVQRRIAAPVALLDGSSGCTAPPAWSPPADRPGARHATTSAANSSGTPPQRNHNSPRASTAPNAPATISPNPAPHANHTEAEGVQRRARPPNRWAHCMNNPTITKGIEATTTTAMSSSTTPREDQRKPSRSAPWPFSVHCSSAGSSKATIPVIDPNTATSIHQTWRSRAHPVEAPPCTGCTAPAAWEKRSARMASQRGNFGPNATAASSTPALKRNVRGEASRAAYSPPTKPAASHANPNPIKSATTACTTVHAPIPVFAGSSRFHRGSGHAYSPFIASPRPAQFSQVLPQKPDDFASAWELTDGDRRGQPIARRPECGAPAAIPRPPIEGNDQSTTKASDD
jgi:hypothetical protein